MSDYYLKKCSRCNKETPHRVTSISRVRGVKLQCFCCGKFCGRYQNIQTLIEWKGGIKND